jgi:hypothetical protein
MPAFVRSNVDPAEIRLVIEIRRDDFDRTSGRVLDALCHGIEAAAVARHEDKIVATVCETVGINGADAG